MYLIRILVITLLTHFGSSFHFLVAQGKDRCFLLEHPKNSPVKVEYEFPDLKLNVDVDLEFRNLPQQDVTSRTQLKEEKGVITYKMLEESSLVCAVAKGPTVNPLRVGLSIEVGQTEEYYKDLAVKEHLSEFQVHIAQMTDDLTQILNEADYMKEHEMTFHGQSEKMNAAAMYWPIVQMSILVVTGVFVVNNLKSFFKSKKLV
mmetsp:Transcript_22265/g.29115  ORF Transcript_22265/g.29115 Transcript_22265/m.29115 type:complete len:203 (-) Transcript_22265:185-793(-)